MNKKKSNLNNKNVKNLSWKKIEDNENYYKNPVKNSNTIVKFPMSNNRQASKKENTSNTKVLHGHNESTGSEHYKNNNYNNKKNIKIKVVQKK